MTEYKPYEGAIIPERSVMFNTETKRKVVITRDIPNDKKYLFVCDRPHGDGDFSYCCGGIWCKCMQ